MYNPIKPVNGAAKYEAGYDNEKPCVWMTIPADEHCDHELYYVVESCKKIETAQKKAIAWQTKENKSVLKHFPELNTIS